ncbi:hypothetical protein AAHC03_02003 [Spirometra sp. Aus1]|nr:unnamed protein product [Spirometra erinaceieuropaei]
MTQENPIFRVESATTFKPKVIKKDDYSKLSKESERLLSFYPDYVEVAKTKKKGKQDVKRLIRLSDVTAVKTDEKHKDLLRVFVNNKGKNECHQMSILNSGDFQSAKDYFERKAQNGGGGNASPTEAVQTVQQSSSIVSEKPSLKKPPSMTVRNDQGRGFSASEVFRASESQGESRRETNSVSNVQYNQHLSIARDGYKPSVRMSGVDEFSDMVQSYVETNERPRSSRLRSYAYYDDSQEEITGGGGVGGGGDDFNSEFDVQTQNPRYRTSYVHSHGRHSHVGSARPYYMRGGSVTPASTVYTEEGFRHYPRRNYDDAYYSEQGEEAYSVGYDSESDRTLIGRPVKPRSIPYYTPFIAINNHKNSYW